MTDYTRIFPIETLVEQFEALGIQKGQTLLVHSGMKALGGWVPGGPQSIIEALLIVLGENGTLMMPAHTPNNTDPAAWQNPPVPEAWWPIIREQTPIFEPEKAECPSMGKIANYFRTYPGVIRSHHPVVSFCAYGKHAEALTRDHGLSDFLGENSPIGRLYALDGHVLLLGVGHSSNTSLHLAEYRATWAGKKHVQEGSAVQVDGVRRWVYYDILDITVEDFETVGAAYEQLIGFAAGEIGQAQARVFRQRPMVDFATTWMSIHRT